MIEGAGGKSLLALQKVEELLERDLLRPLEIIWMVIGYQILSNPSGITQALFDGHPRLTYNWFDFYCYRGGRVEL